MPAPYKIRGLLRRVAQMSREEVAFRVRQQLWNRWEGFRYRAGSVPGAKDDGFVAQAAALAPGRFFFSPAELPALVATLRTRFPQACEETLASAARICAHRFDLLGYRDLGLGPRINWHRDPVHGKQAPREKFHAVPYLDFERVGDAKIIWELNRHQHFVTLGKAYQLTGNEEFTQEFEAQFYAWQEQNPYLMGINWSSSLEVAFRSISWLWARELFSGARGFSARLGRDLLLALGRNARFIEHNLSTYFARNTHLLGEAVALFCAGILCPQLKRSPVWRALGWKIILEEAQHQVHADGGYFEQSSYYHTYALDMLLHARVLAARNQIFIPEPLDRTLAAMLDYQAALSGGGPTPRFGDDDGGRWFDPQRNRGEHLTDPLSTGAVLFSRSDWKASTPGLAEETLWLLGPAGVAEFDALPAAEAPSATRTFPSSGVYLMASDGLRLALDAGPMGAGLCGHGHADSLSLTVAADGREWLTDPGTFTYTGSQPWRDLFRGTAAHNTLRIDAQDQAEPTAPFKWENIPEARVEHRWAGESFDLLVASHTGYLRLPSPVLHRRTVFFLKPQFWLVIDTVLGKGEHLLELNWHAPHGPASLGATALELGSPEQGRMGIVPLSDSRWSVDLVEGWHSACYGQKQPAPVLRCSARTTLPAEFATLLVPRLAETCGRLERLASGDTATGPRGFQYSVGQERHSWMLADGNSNWRLGDFAGEARLAYFGLNSGTGQQRVVLWDGSFLSVEGVKVVALPCRQAHFEQGWIEVRGAAGGETLVEAGALVAGPSGPAR